MHKKIYLDLVDKKKRNIEYSINIMILNGSVHVMTIFHLDYIVEINLHKIRGLVDNTNHHKGAHYLAPTTSGWLDVAM